MVARLRAETIEVSRLDMHLSLREISTNDPSYPKVFELRDAVLRRPLGHSLHNDDTSRDHLERIFIVEDDSGHILACVMLKPLQDGVFKLRQMAVSPEAQGTGIGAILVKAAERAMWTSGAVRIEMHARLTALPFYEKLGYKAMGEEFLEVGIPHFLMQKERPE